MGLNATRPTESPLRPALSVIVDLHGLLSFWDFQEPSGKPRISQGPHSYALREANCPVARVTPAEGAPFGLHAAELQRGQYFFISRADCPALDLHGPDAQVTVVAWLQRYRKREVGPVR